jgi:hypothetical protein
VLIQIFSCIIVLGPFCWKCVRVKAYTALTGVNSRACPLIGSFCIGVYWWKRGNDRNIIFRCSFIGYIFSGVSFCNNKERVFIFDYDTRKHSAIWFSLRGPPRTDSLLFRCSFYYLFLHFRLWSPLLMIYC